MLIAGFTASGFAASGRTVLVSYIKTRTFKNHAHSPVNQAADFLAAFGTDFYGRFIHALERVKSMAAAFTFIFVSRHIIPENNC